MPLKTDDTHYIECFENVGSGKKRRLYQPCRFIRWSESGVAVVETTLTARNNKRKKKGFRYVDKSKLIDMYVNK